MLVIAEQNKDQKLISQCCSIIDSTMEFGWDKEYGGLYYFLDIEGKPPQQLEWNQKLWYVIPPPRPLSGIPPHVPMLPQSKPALQPPETVASFPITLDLHCPPIKPLL